MNRRYRKTVIAGNWKMNMTASETKKFAEDIRKIMPRAKWCETLLCVPACNIPVASKAFKDLRISVGAENVYFEEKGAYTGEVSAEMLRTWPSNTSSSATASAASTSAKPMSPSTKKSTPC